MLPLIDILIVLSGLSAAQASPLRRYANTTSQAPKAMTGVAYHPYAGSPSLSLAPIEGITTLPFSQIAETPAEVPVASSAAPLTLSATSRTIATVAALFSYQPIESDSAGNAGTSSTPCKSQISGAPTSFWTFGDQNVGTVTITSTTYTTVSVPPQVVESASPLESTASQAQNTTTSSVPHFGHTFSLDPLPTSSASATAETDVSTTSFDTTATESPPSSNTQDPEATSKFAYPYPSSAVPTTSTTVTGQDSDATDSGAESPPETSSELPVVVTEGASETQSQQSRTMTDTTAVPGITIIPQNPSVIYITVTDAGATTTVTA